MSKKMDLSSILDGIEAVIFDLDGTLIDSMWMWEQIDRDYLAEYGIELPEDLQAAISGMSGIETATYFHNRFPSIPQTLEEMMDTWNHMAWDMYEHQVTLKAGVIEFLEFLKSKNIRIGVATSNSKELVDMVTKVLGIDKYLEEVHNCNEVEKGKPAPYIYQLVAKCLNCPPEKCLVFEDLCVGIEAGKNAGMRTCGVDDDNSMGEQQEKVKLADYYIHSFSELLEQCNNL